MDWEKCIGKNDAACFTNAVNAMVPGPAMPEPNHQFKMEDCDLLTGWFADARTYCIGAQSEYDQWYDYEYYEAYY